MRDNLWFFSSARYFSVNNFIANTIVRRRQPGHRRPVHQERDGAPDLADLAAQQAVGLLRRDRQVPRPRHAEPRGSGDGLAAVVLARLQHRVDQVDVHRQQQDAARGRLFAQPRVLHQQLPGRRRSSRASPARGSPARHGSRTTSAAARPPRPARTRRARSGTTSRRRSPTSPARTTSRPASSTPGATSCTPSMPTPTSRSSTAATPPACRSRCRTA